MVSPATLQVQNRSNRSHGTDLPLGITAFSRDRLGRDGDWELWKGRIGTLKQRFFPTPAPPKGPKSGIEESFIVNHPCPLQVEGIRDNVYIAEKH